MIAGCDHTPDTTGDWEGDAGRDILGLIFFIRYFLFYTRSVYERPEILRLAEGHEANLANNRDLLSAYLAILGPSRR